MKAFYLAFLIFLAAPSAQAGKLAFDFAPGASVTAFDNGDSYWGIGLMLRSRYYFGSNPSFRFGIATVTDFKFYIPEMLAGVGIELGSKFLIGLDGGLSYSRLWGLGFGSVASIGYLLDEHWSVMFVAVGRLTLGGGLFLDYGPRLGVRF